jgi:hypothetical protein
MPNLSETTVVVIVIAILLFATVLIMGRRLRRFDVRGGGISGTAEGGTTGANVSRNLVEGDLNKAHAEGENSTIARNTVKGSGNEFTAKSGGA